MLSVIICFSQYIHIYFNIFILWAKLHVKVVSDGFFDLCFNLPNSIQIHTRKKDEINNQRKKNWLCKLNILDGSYSS